MTPSAEPRHIGKAELVSLELGDMLKNNKGRRAELSKVIEPSHNGLPKVSIRLMPGGYGPPLASVSVRRSWQHDDNALSLDNLDLRTACEYYSRLDSIEVIDALEKATKAPAPKAWMYIAFIDKLHKEIV